MGGDNRLFGDIETGVDTIKPRRRCLKGKQKNVLTNGEKSSMMLERRGSPCVSRLRRH